MKHSDKTHSRDLLLPLSVVSFFHNSLVESSLNLRFALKAEISNKRPVKKNVASLIELQKFNERG